MSKETTYYLSLDRNNNWVIHPTITATQLDITKTYRIGLRRKILMFFGRKVKAFDAILMEDKIENIIEYAQI